MKSAPVHLWIRFFFNNKGFHQHCGFHDPQNKLFGTTRILQSIQAEQVMEKGLSERGDQDLTDLGLKASGLTEDTAHLKC